MSESSEEQGSVDSSESCAHELVLARARSQARWLALILGSLSAFGPLAIDMYLPAFPTIARDLGSEIGSIQLTLSVFLIGLAVGQLMWGTLSDHWGRRLPMLLGCAAFVAAAVLCAASRSIAVLIAARFMMGLGGSAGVVVSRAVVRDLFDEIESARFYALIMIIGGLAPIIAPTLGGLILTWWSWRVIFVFVATFAAICLAGVFWGIPETLPRSGRASSHPRAVAGKYWGLVRNQQFIYYALAVGFGYSVLFAYISSSPFLFMHLYGVTPQHFSLLFMANAAGIYVTGQSNRFLLRRLTPRQILGRASLLNLGVGTLLMVVTLNNYGGFPLFYALVFMLVASLGWIFPNLIAVAMKPVADQAGSASALLGVLQFTFGAASTSLTGRLSNGTAMPAVSVIAISSLLSWLVIVLFAERHEARAI